jgi:GNAT superfamily N-acetyltransferase
VNPQQPRPIEATDNTIDFESGEESLDRYLADRALTNHLADLGRCYVCIDADTHGVVGYYTLSAVAVEHADLPGKVRRNAPNPVPAVLMGRLAIDTHAQGSGLGRFLVRDAILSTLAAADSIGVRILLVHALHEPAAPFYEKLGFKRSPTDPLHLYLLLAAARKSLSS